MKFPPVQTAFYQFGGGLDQVSPPLTMKEGVVISSLNFECGVYGGYTRIKGYERYDGQASPSLATYQGIPVSVTGSYALGDAVTGVTSGATGILIAVTASTWFLTKIVGTFEAETLNISGSPVATSSAGTSSGGAATAALNASYLNLAADQYRADIAAVPGSGSILGVWQYNGEKYAIRNNAGGTAAVMHKASASGWTAVALGMELNFTSGGTTEIAVGDTITGATSGATAVVTGIGLQSGTWESGTAAGVITFASQTGTFQAENLDVGAAPNLATIAGDSAEITLLPGGRFEFVNYNFGGDENTTKMYGCDGVNRAFEFDGTVFIPISTGMAVDTPEHITAFKKHLFISIAGSVQHSGIGAPHTWTVITGAAELAVGDQCTGFLLQTGGTSVGTLIIFNRNQTYILYGNISADWNLVLFNPEAGSVPYTQQFIGMGVLLDDRGITTVGASQNFGNFTGATISRKVDPFLRDQIDSVIASCISRENNQYRLFFSGGDALYATFDGGKLSGMMPITLTNPVTCICSQENSNGVEEVFYGSTNGMVYQMDKGTSFDGEPIIWDLHLSYNHFKSPRLLKQFRKATIEVSGATYCSFNFAYSLGYGSSELVQPNGETVENNLSSTNWDNFTWDNFFWDGQSLLPSEGDIDGTAENISLVFSGSSDEYDSFNLNGASITYTPRRMMR